jgi:HAD superfamily hydrolase (TIGR01484 family)
MPERLLLCTDLDRTLLPNGPQPEAPQARGLFARLVAQPTVVLAYVTGRHRALVEQAVTEYRLPRPAFVIADVGTTIYRVDGEGEWQPEQGWERAIALDWNGRSRQDLDWLLSGIPELHPQEESKQGRHKLSYYFDPAAGQARLEVAVRKRLDQLAVHTRLVWSIDHQPAIGLLDVLPACASKYHAIERLQALTGFGDDNTVFSGDSGNDLEVLASPVPSVLVANSDDAVRTEALRLAAGAGNSERLYLARGGLMGMNGNYSAGILEGVVHYHPDTAQWLAGEAGI